MEGKGSALFFFKNQFRFLLETIYYTVLYLHLDKTTVTIKYIVALSMVNILRFHTHKHMGQRVIKRIHAYRATGLAMDPDLLKRNGAPGIRARWVGNG